MRMAYRGVVFLMLCGVILTSWAVFSGGCASIYSRSEEAQPADAGDRLRLRVREARNEGLAALAALKAVEQAQAGEARSAAGEQLELRGWEVQRRALAISDVSGKGGQSSGPTTAARLLEAAGKAVVEAAGAVRVGSLAQSELKAARERLEEGIKAADAVLAV